MRRGQFSTGRVKALPALIRANAGGEATTRRLLRVASLSAVYYDGACARAAPRAFGGFLGPIDRIGPRAKENRMYDPLESGYELADFSGFVLARTTAVIATPREDWGVQVATVFYATDDGINLYVKSHLASDHGTQVQRDSRVALAVYDHASTYSEKYGVQLLGICHQVTEREELIAAIEIFSRTFPGARERFAPIEELLSPGVKSTLFRIRAMSGKMLTPAGYSSGYQVLAQG